MSNVFFYEPFYDLDRFIETLNGSSPALKAAPRQQNSAEGVVRSLKPRCVYRKDTPLFRIADISQLRLDLHEDTDKNLVTASFEFPGVPKESIQIDVQDGKLTVSADTKQSVDLNEGGYAVRERRFGKYSRTLQLPQGVKVCFK